MNRLTKVSIPYGGYWSTPFSKWQNNFSHLHSLQFAAHVTKHALADRGIDAKAFDNAVLGYTVPQELSFYGLPWFMGMIGNTEVPGTVVQQACATGARSVATAAQDLESGVGTASLVVTADRTSNAPTVIYPDPTAPAGAPTFENWVLSNFARDPLGGPAMVGTAENCARDWQISTEEQHDVVARRWEQYEESLADDHAFQKRYMKLPFAVPDKKFKKTMTEIPGDEGIRPSTRDGLAKLQPVEEGGTVTFAGQTHPADGNAGIIMTTPEKAKDFSKDPNIEITLLGFGSARTKPHYMPHAPVPAARNALAMAGVELDQIDAVKTHNPFAVNDVVFARETGYDWKKMNNYGCSLIYGHPQGPTGMRIMIELIEELVQTGGGYGLFTGCAAGDSAMAAVIHVADKSKS